MDGFHGRRIAAALERGWEGALLYRWRSEPAGGLRDSQPGLPGFRSAAPVQYGHVHGDPAGAVPLRCDAGRTAFPGEHHGTGGCGDSNDGDIELEGKLTRKNFDAETQRHRENKSFVFSLWLRASVSNEGP